MASGVLSAVAALAPNDAERPLYSNLLSVVASGSALVFAINVIARQKLTGILPRLHFSLGLGLALWFAAEASWAYYEVVEGESQKPAMKLDTGSRESG
jgi:hypothetical protein